MMKMMSDQPGASEPNSGTHSPYGGDLLESPDAAVRMGAARVLGDRTASRGAFARLLDRLEVEEDGRVLAELGRALCKHVSRSNAQQLVGRLWVMRRDAVGARRDAARAMLHEVGVALGWVEDQVNEVGRRWALRTDAAAAPAADLSSDAPFTPEAEAELAPSHMLRGREDAAATSVPLPGDQESRATAPDEPVPRAFTPEAESAPRVPAQNAFLDPVDRAREHIARGERVAAVTLLQEAVRGGHPRAKLSAAWLGALLLSTGQQALADEYLAMVQTEPRPPHLDMERVRAFCRDRGVVPLPAALREPRSRPDHSLSSLPTHGASEDSQPVDMVALARTRLPERFQDVELIGTGGMGIVFRAHDTELDRDVAIKLIAPDHWTEQRALKRFVLEARALARLSHPAVLRIHDIHRGEVPFFTMELLEGHALDALLADGLPPIPVLIRQLIPVLEALDLCHESGLIHRDVKPRNIFVTTSGDLRLMDFGIVKSAGATSMTRAGAIVGTPHYMSPEQLIGTRVDRRADIYAFGVTLFQMLTGVLPFRDPGEVFARPAPSVRDWVDISPELSGVVDRCLKRSPDDRWQTCRELIHALQPFTEQTAQAASEGLTVRDIFSAVMFEALRNEALAGREQELIFAVRRLLDVSAEVHQEVFRDTQARVRSERAEAAAPPISPEALFRLVVRRHLKDSGANAVLEPLLDEVGRMLEIPRPRRRQLERELSEELQIEASIVPGRSSGPKRRPRA